MIVIKLFTVQPSTLDISIQRSNCNSHKCHNEQSQVNNEIKKIRDDDTRSKKPGFNHRGITLTIISHQWIISWNVT